VKRNFRANRRRQRLRCCPSLNFRVLAEWITPAYDALMAKFYVFHASPKYRARIHDGECNFCCNGQGVEKQPKNGSGVTGWDGPFSTLQEAEAKMATFRFKDVGRCKNCLGG
jgi:hypothetical protein